MDFNFQRRRIDTIPEDKKIEALENAAKHFNYIEFSWRDFNKVSTISASAIKTHFGSWKKGLAALKKHLQQKGLNLSPRPYAPQRIYSDKDLFDEMGRIWQKVGQRPSRTEWEASDPKISIGAYKKRFGSWTNACQKFIEFQIGGDILSDTFVRSKEEDFVVHEKNGKVRYSKENSRNVSLSLRYKVLNRDHFKCVFCGKNPSTDFGTKLHIDHIIPFSKGGKSTLENLQTLCDSCNLGKSDSQE
ncbi:MAG: HNH endonuclease [Methanoregula sp.]|jgi:5-methylcytosine-specific restriction endonuclease McrA|uniref:homing endonuclease associated repeat-containing protein n=1 Tax=Methanoregula sp. TaxID=2052170 RepID=UPI003C18B4E4